MEVDSRQVRGASRDLKRFTVITGGAEKSADKMGLAAIGASKATGVLGTAARRVAVQVAALGVAFVSFAAINQAKDAALGFAGAVSEVSTLIEGTPEQLAALESGARSLATTFGGTAQDQIKGYYQAISAGADGVRGATDLLNTANKLAIGGVTDVATGVDILTTAVNSYGSEILSPIQASDALFIGMKDGKTTVGELAHGLGNVIPIANALGISFDETVGAVSALTTQGIATSQAITGIRAAMIAVIGPSEQAKKLAKGLGLEFNAQALKAKGLQGFLGDVIAKTHGSAEAMRVLFSSTEATTSALALAGGGSAKFAAIMEDMKNKTGATATAFAKMAGGDLKRWEVAVAAGSDALLGLGKIALAVLLPAMEAAAGVLNLVSDNAGVFGAVLVALAVTQIPAVIGALSVMVAGETAATIATGALSAALFVLRGAVSFLGGPIGIALGLLAGAVTFLTLFKKQAVLVQDPTYEAAAAIEGINSALGVFRKTSAPDAAQKAIDLANNYKILARDALNAAEAEVALASASLASIKARTDNQPNNLMASTEMQAANERVADSLRFIAEAQTLVNKARVKSVAVGEDVIMGMKVLTHGTKNEGDALSSVNKILKQLYDKSTGSIPKTVSATDKLTAAQSGLATEMNGNVTDAIGNVTDAFSNFLIGGLHDFNGFVHGVLNQFKSLLAQMISLALRNKIIIGLGLGGSVAGSAASAAGRGIFGGFGGGGGLIGGFLGGGSATGTLGLPSIFSGGGLLGTIGGAFSGASAGTGLLGSIGGFISGGISSAIGGITSGLAAGGLTGIASAIGAAVPVLGAIVGIISIGKKLFGRKLKDTGIVGTFDYLKGLEASSFKFFKGGLFRGNKTTYAPLADAVKGPLQDAFTKISENVVGLATNLNALPDFSNFAFNFKFSTAGLTQEKIQKKFQDLMLSMGDSMSQMIVGLDGFSQSGETAYETLQRLGGSLDIVNRVFKDFGFTLKTNSLAGAAAASSFVDLFGSANNFLSSTQSYYDNFFTNSEKTANATRHMSDELATLGIDVIPSTRRAYRSLVDAAIGSGNDSLAASLIQLSGSFSDLKNMTNQAAFATDNLTGSTSKYVTLQDEQFAKSSRLAGSRFTAQKQTITDPETQSLLRELLTAIKTGNINISKNTSKTAQILERIDLKPA
jgi:TP901 family phage tail tape measure protein